MANDFAKQDANATRSLMHAVGNDIKNVTPDTPLPVTIVGASTVTSQGYFSDHSVLPLTTGYQEVAFGFTSIGIILMNDAESGDFTFSWNGACTNIAGIAKAGESITMQNCKHASIHLKCTLDSQPYRLIVW